ncbi:D-alanyl-D-alanine carboxypeptidase DacA [Bdellovibrio bacteriovorus]|uniref:D-alanyl-D-alanine carboxypeptidase family protein n=1 Tax=Bdellovibrio bacteriovorus TaxID=959 RepID=UPI000655766F|nr:D-alanyl-D-alanine carboxypeptidase family protein [Bdellovibrio bacteriovorus]BEV68425.1 D-alanyl-D-alanine carboxypeptidase DacA [Bdellovibrio bacteriovorus]
MECLRGLLLLFVCFLCLKAQALPSVKALSWVLLDASSGRILAELNKDQRLPPASLTKVMTAYMVFSEIREGRLSRMDRVKVSEQAIIRRPEESSMYLRVGEFVTVEELLRGLIVASANDAALVLAEVVSGSQKAFTEQMNKTAQKLGMTQSLFANSSGLYTEKHYSTAKDLGLLAVRISQEFPEYFEYSSSKELTFRDFHKKNTNDLLFSKLPVDGMKTGHIKAAGWCVMVSARKNKRPDKKSERYIAVVLGAPSNQDRFVAGRALLEFAFSQPSTFKESF